MNWASKRLWETKLATGETTIKIIENIHQRRSLDYIKGNRMVTETHLQYSVCQKFWSFIVRGEDTDLNATKARKGA